MKNPHQINKHPFKHGDILVGEDMKCGCHYHFHRRKLFGIFPYIESDVLHNPQCHAEGDHSVEKLEEAGRAHIKMILESRKHH